MKTLLFFIFIFSVFSLPQIPSENDWKFVGGGGSSIDSAKTKTFVKKEGQVFCGYGWPFGGFQGASYWKYQTTWVKEFWNSFPNVPDTTIVRIRCLGTNSTALKMVICMQDTNTYVYYFQQTIQQDSEWQDLVWDTKQIRDVFNLQKFGKLYMVFMGINTDSTYMWFNVEVSCIKGKTKGVETIYDNFGNTTKISDQAQNLKSFELEQNYPNPFNPSTKIRYSIPVAGFVSLKVCDISGKEVQTLVNEEKTAGNYEAVFNASNLPSGVYFYRLQAGNSVKTNKMILLK